MDQDAKLAALAKVGRALNAAKVTWAVGASLLLYFHGIADDFHDVDLMTTEADVARVREILLALGTLAPPHPAAQYKTRHFLEFTIDGVEFDVMAGFVITCDGADHDCPFTPAHIDGYREVDGVSIPLQRVSDWRGYYARMGRAGKVALIDRAARF